MLPSREPSSPPEIVFEGKKLGQRTCINCSKEFNSDVSEVIPVCPKCRGVRAKKSNGPIKRAWTVYRGGRAIELESDVVVRQQIRQGEILPNDRLVSPGGKRATAKRFAQFQEAFQSREKTRSKPTTTPSVRFARRYYRPTVFVQSVFFLVVGFTVAWAAYRTVTYQPPPSSDPALLQKIEELKQQIPVPTESAEGLVKEARATMALDRPEKAEKAVTLLEQALIADPSSPVALGLLAEAYSLLIPRSTHSNASKKALDTANLARRLYPRRAEAEIARARVALAQGNASLARSSSTLALNRDPDNERALLARARALLATSKDPGSLNQVIALATRATERNPALLEAYDLMGETFFLHGEPKLSINAYEQRLQQSPEDGRALFRIGLIEERANRFAQARQWYQEALRTNPNSVPARLHLALIYHRIDSKPDRAERHLRLVLGRYQKFAEKDDISTASRELVRILLASKREGEAGELARKLPAVVSETSDLVIAQARSLEQVGAVDSAINSIESYLSSHPEAGKAKFVLAQIRERQEKTEEAIRIYRSLLTDRPQWIDPYFFLIRLLLTQEKDEEALDIANAAISRAGLVDQSDLSIRLSKELDETDWKSFLPPFRKLSKRHPDSAIALALLGLTHFKANHRISALRDFRKAQQMANSMDFVKIYIGRTLLTQKKSVEASKVFKSALTTNPTSSVARYWLGVALTKRKRLGQAEKALSIVATDDVWGYRAMNILGDIALARGEKTTAETWWKKSLAREPRYAPPWRSLLTKSSD